MITACTQCQNHLPSNHKEPLQAKPRPMQPFQEAAADLCSHAGRSYLVWVDCYSNWPIIAPMDTNTTATHLTAVCNEIFSQTAVPDILWTDGGPQFTSRAFQDYLQEWGVIHKKSLHTIHRATKGRGDSKSYEKVNQSSMDREIFRQDHTLPSSPSVLEHAFS